MRLLVLGGFALLLASTAVAHKATERYIPIGQSPGISGKYSYVGEIAEVNERSHTMSIENKSGEFHIRMGSDTKYYLDRSTVKKTNLKGSYADCKPGRRVEVKFRNNDPQQPAEWIKVEITQ